MHCNLRSSEPRQPFPAYDAMPSLKLHYSIFAADILLCAVTLTFDPVTLTFDIWPWTFAEYRLWRDETLYQIWTQSSNPRRSYCDFCVWHYDLEHVLSIVLSSGITFTKFDLRQLIRAWIIAFLCWYVMSRWDFDLWPFDLEFLKTSGVMCINSVQNLSEIE